MQVPREERVSHSEVDSYLLCLRKHYYAYIKSIERRATSKSLSLGSMGHAVMDTVLQMWLDTGEPANMKVVKGALMEYVREQPDTLELVNKLTEIFEAYFETNPLADYKPLAVEKTFVWKIHDNLYLPFRVDAIMRHNKTKKIVVIDHKFTANFYKPWNIDLLPQIPKYAGALREMGLPADSGAYLMFRTGYRKNAEPEEIVKLAEFELNENRVRETVREQIVSAMDIQRRKRMHIDEADASAVRVANNLVCNSCSFQEICVSDLNGYASDLLLKSSYRIKQNEQVFQYVQQ